MSYKRKIGDTYSKLGKYIEKLYDIQLMCINCDRLIRCMDNNDLPSFSNILNKQQYNLDIEYEDKETGHTLLTYACCYNLFDFIKILIENKDADVNHANSQTNDSPLHYASYVYYINHQISQNISSMKYIASCNNGVILKFLVSNDADIFAKNNEGYNAMEYALLLNHISCYNEFTRIIDTSYHNKYSKNKRKKKKDKKKHYKSSLSSTNLSTLFCPSRNQYLYHTTY